MPGRVKTHKNTAILERHEKKRAEAKKHKTEANLECHNTKRGYVSTNETEMNLERHERKRGKMKKHKNEENLEPHGAGFARCYSNYLQKQGKGCKGRDEGSRNPETGLGCRRRKNQAETWQKIVFRLVS